MGYGDATILEIVRHGFCKLNVFIVHDPAILVLVILLKEIVTHIPRDVQSTS